MSADAPAGTPATLTVFRKIGGPLTKRVRVDHTGSVISDGSACVMTRGTADRIHLADIAELAELIDAFEPEQALALGMLLPEMPDHCEVTTKRKLADLDGKPRPGLIARTGETIRYKPQQPAYALLDFDTKGIPPDVKERIKVAGGFRKALLSVLPALEGVAHVARRSTSAGLFRTNTKERLPGSGGQHIYLAVKDGADIPRFLITLHEACWLAGFGWGMAGAGGQFLERSIVDRMVGAPERLVFEGSPVLEPPLAQDRERRRPVVRRGSALDTAAACPPLTLVQRAQFALALRKERYRLKPDLAKARKAFIAEHAQRLIERAGLRRAAAEGMIGKQCDGVLLPSLELPFDDDDLSGSTVADVLADPDRFVGATLADPLEGRAYGSGKAMIMRRDDGSLWVNSFAHGRTVYELKFDAAAVAKVIDAAAKEDAAKLFVRQALLAELSVDEIEDLRNSAAAKAGINKTTVGRMLKKALERQKQDRMRERAEQQADERTDPRPQIRAPLADAPWIPQMQIINEVLGASTAAEPPMRETETDAVQVRNRRVRNLHLLNTLGANPEENSEKK